MISGAQDVSFFKTDLKNISLSKPVMTQSMTFSPYKKPFEERITKWDIQLNLVSEILDEWITLQRQWMYLEPIFSSDDIMQQLPLEGKRFASVDRTWRKVSSAISE